MLSESGGIAAEDGRALRRFLIVDSHDPVRQSLSRLIERRPEWRLVGEAACAAEGLRLAQENRPHVAIVDLKLRGSDGIDLTQSLVAVLPDLRIVGYSFQDDGLSIARFLEAGGTGFVSKHEPPRAIVEAIEQALAGRIRVALREGSASEERCPESQSSA